MGAQSSPSGYTALHLACLSYHVVMVGLMLAIPPYPVFFYHYRRECLWGLSPRHPVTLRCTWPASLATWVG